MLWPPLLPVLLSIKQALVVFSGYRAKWLHGSHSTLHWKLLLDVVSWVQDSMQPDIGAWELLAQFALA